MNMPADSMERIIPDLIDPQDNAAQLSLRLHMERYQFACENLLPGRVLDIACGTGYGTRLMPVERSIQSVPPYRALAQSRLPP